MTTIMNPTIKGRQLRENWAIFRRPTALAIGVFTSVQKKGQAFGKTNF